MALTISPSKTFSAGRLVFDAAASVAKSALVAEAPWLAHPVANAVLDFAIQEFSDKLYPPLGKLVSFGVIDLNSWSQTKEFAVAAKNLDDALNRFGIDTKEVQNASDDYDRAADDLGRINP